MIELDDKTYDEFDEDTEDTILVELRCRTCGATDSLVEITWVPRHMGAVLLHHDNDTYTADLQTSDDTCFWESEKDHQWGCSSCVSEGNLISDVFDIAADVPEAGTHTAWRAS